MASARRRRPRALRALVAITITIVACGDDDGPRGDPDTGTPDVDARSSDPDAARDDASGIDASVDARSDDDTGPVQVGPYTSSVRTLEVDGETRTFLLVRPDPAPAGLPLVIGFHGDGEDDGERGRLSVGIGHRAWRRGQLRIALCARGSRRPRAHGRR